VIYVPATGHTSRDVALTYEAHRRLKGARATWWNPVDGTSRTAAGPLLEHPATMAAAGTIGC